jgi:1,4-dihydroxy-2-naphthoyl-CoA hydrolase
MKIWISDINLHDVSQACKNTMIEHIGIEFLEIGDDYLRARMPVDHRTKQPYGIMHGGASCVLAETTGSMAAYFCIDNTKF